MSSVRTGLIESRAKHTAAHEFRLGEWVHTCFQLLGFFMSEPPLPLACTEGTHPVNKNCSHVQGVHIQVMRVTSWMLKDRWPVEQEHTAVPTRNASLKHRCGTRKGRRTLKFCADIFCKGLFLCLLFTTCHCYSGSPSWERSHSLCRAFNIRPSAQQIQKEILTADPSGSKGKRTSGDSLCRQTLSLCPLEAKAAYSPAGERTRQDGCLLAAKPDCLCLTLRSYGVKERTDSHELPSGPDLFKLPVPQHIKISTLKMRPGHGGARL